MIMLTAIVLMILSVAIHFIGMLTAFRLLTIERNLKTVNVQYLRAIKLNLILVMMMLATTLEALIWAVSYLLLEGITDINALEDAFYFSMVTYTTLGYGDIVLNSEWRILSAMQAATGIIIFGWTTSIFIVSLQRIFPHKRHEAQDN